MNASFGQSEMLSTVPVCPLILSFSVTLPLPPSSQMTMHLSPPALTRCFAHVLKKVTHVALDLLTDYESQESVCTLL